MDFYRDYQSDPKHNDFTTAYIRTALWTETDEDGEPLDKNYKADDIHPDTLARMVADCARFQKSNGDRLPIVRLSRAGHDFWLTRNGHGAGFWDGDWPEHGEALTASAKTYGTFDLYVGDDNKLHAD